MEHEQEVCRVCGRKRPDYIADPSCSKGGYCEWKEKEDSLPIFQGISPRLEPVKVRRMWLPLMPPASQFGMVYFTVQPDLPFKPCGLMLWDFPNDAILEMCKVANEETVICGHGKLPAKVFSRADSYEKLQKLVEDGEEFFSEWMDCPPIDPANRITVLFSSATGNFERARAAFWGIATVRR